MNGMQNSPLWHPFTQHGLEGAMTPIRSANGAWLEAASGQKIFDAISSWWVVTLGHCHPKIVAAIGEQARVMDQVIFAGFTHEPAETVAKALVAAAPPGLAHVFLSDSGSTSVEVALKMALGTWRNRGAARTRIVALEHAYHGDTVGAMSAGARGVFNAPYSPMLFDVTRIPFPSVALRQTTFDALDAACAKGDVAAFICEPLVLGAGGMLMYGAATLAEMQRITAHHGVLFIADEVMTGFGRTGTMFACQQAGFTPDILCVAKGLSGGALPLAATLCTAPIFEAHISDDRARMFFHSSSYTANPIACAAAAANLDIWKSEAVSDRVTTLAGAQARFAARLAQHSRLSSVRQCGTIVAADLDGARDGYLSNVTLELRRACLTRGVLIRPLGATLYVMPPYCATDDDLEFAYGALLDAIDEVAP